MRLPPIQVLIVDDDPMVLKVNRSYVEAVSGFKVVGTARNGNDALEAARRLRPDLVLLDVYMPDKDGLTMLREFRSQGIPSDVILVSAAHDTQSIQEAFRCGAHDYIIKPFSDERLQAALESYRSLKAKLLPGAELSQDQLDRMRRVAVQPMGDEPPKGLNDWTLAQVVGFLERSPEPPTTGEAAEGLGISRVTARRYLDYLVKVGRVRVEMQYGTPGRPLNRYALVRS
jgi:two-component system response regulator DctR